MMKLTLCCLINFAMFISSLVYADTWVGEFYNITPTHMGVTEQYCKEHVLDTYQATPEVAVKQITAKNGVIAKDLGYSTKEQGSIYLHNGIAEFSGTYDEKPWIDKAYYFGLMLMAKGGMQQGAWYTKDCKGFYRVGPTSS